MENSGIFVIELMPLSGNRTNKFLFDCIKITILLIDYKRFMEIFKKISKEEREKEREKAEKALLEKSKEVDYWKNQAVLQEET